MERVMALLRNQAALLCACLLLLASTLTGFTAQAYTQEAPTIVVPELPVFTENVSVQVPILMYHMLVPDGEPTRPGLRQVSHFRNDLRALRTAGFTTITFTQLIAFATNGDELPERPVLITFDDGYLDNYTLGFPVLQEERAHATIFVIGWCRGRNTRESGETINAHFSLDQAMTMYHSGWVDIQSHSYNLHERYPSPHATRNGVLQNHGEPISRYIAALRQDIAHMQSRVFDPMGRTPTVFAYPFGYWQPQAERVLRDAGFVATVTTENRIATVYQGAPDSLFGLPRIDVQHDISSGALVTLVTEMLAEI